LAQEKLKASIFVCTLPQGKQLNHNKLTARISCFIHSKKGIFLVHTVFRQN